MIPLYGVPSGLGAGVDWRLFEAGPRAVGFDAAGRMYLASGDAYRIDVLEADRVVRSVRRQVPLREITSADVDEYREASLAVLDTLSMPDEMRPEQRDQFLRRVESQERLGLPEVFDPISALLVSPDGSFWVGARADETPAEAEVGLMWTSRRSVPNRPTIWDLFGADGAYLGEVSLPARFRPDAVEGFRVIGVLADDLDVEYVVAFEVVLGEAAGESG